MSKANPNRPRRCLHCSLMGPEHTMRLVPGAGWLHEPIDGCQQATATDANRRSRHQADRSYTMPGGGGTYSTPSSRFVELDEDAFKLADRD